MKPVHINAKTISDAWFQLIWHIFGGSYIQAIQRGSFEGEQHRLQYPGASIYIEMPNMDIVPAIPVGLGIPAPTEMEYIENYFANYLMDPDLAENETYKYASRIHAPMLDVIKKAGTQLERIVEMLKETPLTNHAILEIATPQDLDICIGNDGKCDPPCLRLIDFKIIPIRDELILTVSVYFRSWDLWAGLPSNLGGIELLKQYVAGETGLKNGPMYAYSSGLHIYKYQEEMARIRTNMDRKDKPEATPEPGDGESIYKNS